VGSETLIYRIANVPLWHLLDSEVTLMTRQFRDKMNHYKSMFDWPLSLTRRWPTKKSSPKRCGQTPETPGDSSFSLQYISRRRLGLSSSVSGVNDQGDRPLELYAQTPEEPGDPKFFHVVHELWTTRVVFE
jgi:hypothetical protein